ncbi:hypothetical protein [Streptomyces sp. NPDC096351]|uniref:hypothetical protein n=1 Tax=Streptomyces sp. NPDC096351 TaxID=3366087 RepID=UPI00381D7796
MADAALSDFNPSACADARKDPRYPVVLDQVEKLTWPAGQPMVPGGWAETLAIQVVAAVRKQEGQHRLITHHTYEGPGPCNASFYGTASACGYPRSEHQLVEGDEPEPAAADHALDPGTVLTLQDVNMLTVPLLTTISIEGPGGQPLVTLNTATGEMEFGPAYTPDAAAEVFWDAVDRMGLAPARADLAARAAKERAWALVGEWRKAAAARDEDPYGDPHAQALAAALTGTEAADPQPDGVTGGNT